MGAVSFLARLLDRATFTSWIGTLDGRPTLWNRDLLSWRGWRLSLHQITGADDPGCFHTHPAWALRIVLAGGYVEELENGVCVTWRPGCWGLVAPFLSHRIVRPLRECSYSLWLRGPKVAQIELRGTGWER